MFQSDAFSVVAAKAARTVEDGVGAVVIVADLDPRLDEMRPQRARRNLKFQLVERHAIVVADLTLFLNAENLPEIDARDGDESSAFLLRLDGKPRIVGRDIHIPEKHVGGFHCRDLRQGQFFRQPVLQRLEDPFRTTPCLWRIGRDMFDAQMIQGAPDLRQICPVDPGASLRRVEIMAAAIRVETQRQAMLPNTSFNARNVEAVPSSSTKKAE